jgi:hypothetical protein
MWAFTWGILHGGKKWTLQVQVVIHRKISKGAISKMVEIYGQLYERVRRGLGGQHNN